MSSTDGYSEKKKMSLQRHCRDDFEKGVIASEEFKVVRLTRLAVDDLRRATLGERVICEVLEDLGFTIGAGDDHVVTIHGSGRRCAGALGPGEHIEKCQRVTVAG